MADSRKGKGSRSEAQHRSWPTKLPFATLELVNEAGQKMASLLGQNSANIPDHHRSRMDVKRVETKVAATAESDVSDYESDTTDQPTSESWKVTWPLCLEDLHVSESQPDLHLSIGRGRSSAGPNRGVDILIACPGKPPKGVISVHAYVRIHSKSGFPMIGGVKDAHPVKLLMMDGRYKELGADKWHILCQRINRFWIGELDCMLTYPESTQSDLNIMRRARNRLFKKNDLAAPDARLPVLPFKKPLIQIEDTIVYEYIASGAFGFVGIGVDQYLGEVRAVKSIRIRDEGMRQEILREAKVSLRLAGEPGILETYSVSCIHGNFFGPQDFHHMWSKLSTCAFPEEIYLTSKLAKDDFSSIRIDRLGFQNLVNLFAGVLDGLENLHSRGCMHRDVTVRNMLIMSEDPPQGVLCDFGKTILGQTYTSKSAGPVTTRAPEIDGTHPYSNAVDVWSFGYAFARVLIPDMTTTTRHNNDGRQSERWIRRISHRLDAIGDKSPLHRHIIDLVKEMLSFEPENRPSIVSALERWTESLPVPSALSSDDESPPKKFQKGSGSTRVARHTSLPAADAAAVKERSNDLGILQELGKFNREARDSMRNDGGLVDAYERRYRAPEATEKRVRGWGDR